MTGVVELLNLTAADPTLLTVRAFRHALRDALRAASMPERAFLTAFIIASEPMTISSSASASSMPRTRPRGRRSITTAAP